MISRVLFIGICMIMFSFLFVNSAFAHCDTMGGPVIKDAKEALEKGDITPVLKWIKKEYETEIIMAFNKTLSVRTKGTDAKELADMYFFETLVRIHRAGEGAPYTGLKPAGTVLEPSVAEADKALESGSADELVRMIVQSVTDGIKDRFAEVLEKKKHRNESVQAGREFVEAYVIFVHYVERLDVDSSGQEVHQGEDENHH